MDYQTIRLQCTIDFPCVVWLYQVSTYQLEMQPFVEVLNNPKIKSANTHKAAIHKAWSYAPRFTLKYTYSCMVVTRWSILLKMEVTT